MSQNKPKIAITIDADLLERIDRVSELREQKRSLVIERMLRNEINAEEEFVRDMEDPIKRALLTTLLNTPGVASLMAKTLKESMTPADVQEMKESLMEQADLGKRRRQAKKKKPTK